MFSTFEDSQKREEVFRGTPWSQVPLGATTVNGGRYAAPRTAFLAIFGSMASVMTSKVFVSRFIEKFMAGAKRWQWWNFWVPAGTVGPS